MSTVADVQDLEKLKQALADVRSDVNGVQRKAWVVLGHVDNNPNRVDVLDLDTSANASLDGFRSLLKDDQVMYGLIRLTATVDMSSTVKFIYVHWQGENIPFVKKGRFGVVHGSVEQYFGPYHINIETGHEEDLSDEALTAKLDDSSGTSNKVIASDDVKGRQERGFTQHSVKREEKGVMKTVGPDGAEVDVSDELREGIADVRQNASQTTWVLSAYEDGDLKKPLILASSGSGDIEELTEHLDDELIMYGIYRLTDTIDDIPTIKFVYIYWVGDKVKPITKGKVSAMVGTVEKIFSPVHVTLSFTSRYEITEEIVRDKVMSSSGSKSFVM